MTVENLVNAIGIVDEKYIEEAAVITRKRFLWVKIAYLSACFVIIFSVLFSIPELFKIVGINISSTAQSTDNNAIPGLISSPMMRQPMFFYKGSAYWSDNDTCLYNLPEGYTEKSELIYVDYSLIRDNFEGNMKGEVYWNPNDLSVMYIAENKSDVVRYIPYKIREISSDIPNHFFYDGKVYVITSMWYTGNMRPEEFKFLGSIKNVGNVFSGIDFEGNFEGNVYVYGENYDIVYHEIRLADGSYMYSVLKERKK
ncbi:MAG: hypothetical protein IJX27_06000 [Clostridia bacterium]|nr:hypothetical protein [Clostridia bacterium]